VNRSDMRWAQGRKICLHKLINRPVF
jgi:hypothetical protein